MDIENAVWRNSDTILITILAVLDLFATGWLIKFALDSQFMPVIIGLDNPVAFTNETNKSVIYQNIVTIDSQLLNSLIVIKSVIWHMGILQLFRRIDGQNPERA